MRDLLERQYGQRAQFLDMGLRLDGGQLDGQKAHTMFKLRYDAKQPDLVIIFRDLDAPAGNEEMRRKREALFAEMNVLVDGKGLNLLHVYTIEALLIAHIEVFQKKYGWQCKVPANPTTIARPVQFLRDASRNSRRRYDKASCPDMMELVDYPFLTKRCRYFADFDRPSRRNCPHCLSQKELCTALPSGPAASAELCEAPRPRPDHSKELCQASCQGQTNKKSSAKPSGFGRDAAQSSGKGFGRGRTKKQRTFSCSRAN